MSYKSNEIDISEFEGRCSRLELDVTKHNERLVACEGKLQDLNSELGDRVRRQVEGGEVSEFIRKLVEQRVVGYLLEHERSVDGLPHLVETLQNLRKELEEFTDGNGPQIRQVVADVVGLVTESIGDKTIDAAQEHANAVLQVFQNQIQDNNKRFVAALNHDLSTRIAALEQRKPWWRFW